MFAKHRGNIIATLVFLLFILPGHWVWAAGEGETLGILPPNIFIILDKIKNSDSACRSTDCRALAALLEMNNIVFRSWVPGHGDFLPGPGGDAARRRTQSGPVIRGQIQHALWDHPELFQSICSRIISLAAHFYNHGPDAGDSTLPSMLVLTAEMLDWRQHMHCLQPTLQALPIDRYMIENMTWSRDWCFHSQWRNPGCRRIVFPQPGAPDPDPLPDSTPDAKNPAK